MKLLIRILPLLLLTAIISCQKEISFETPQNGPGGGPGAGAGTLRMNINSKLWVADLAAGGSLMAGFINITGQGKDGSLFTMTLHDTVARTYTFTNVIPSFDSAHVAVYGDSTYLSNDSWGTEQGDDPSLVGGWVNISKIDKVKKTMTGTFQMKMFREKDSSTIMITEGRFDNMPYATELPPASATDTFRVKIGGTSWAPSSIVGVVNMGSLAIVANENPMNRTVGVTMPSDIIPGSYTLDFLSGQYIGLYNPNTTTTLASKSGTLTIIEHNTSSKRIRGNFNFLAEPVLGGAGVNLTEGYFSIKYQ